MGSSGVSVEFRDVGYDVPLPKPPLMRRFVSEARGAIHRSSGKADKSSSPADDNEPSDATSHDVEAGPAPETGVLPDTTSASQKTAKRILQGVSGYVSAGESLAILGPSGSGKTSLLNLLSGRSQHGLSEGQILFDGAPRDARTKRKIGYVMQDDVFFAKLTVKETLDFTAAIRMPQGSTKEVDERVDDVVQRLRLEKCLRTRIGDQMFDKGISGGERKRVNIANELLGQPQVLLLDEPTSGLDASTAMSVVRLLRELADEGTTVIFTIHQPSSAMFGLFDKIMLLSEGHVAYFGHAREAESYFSSVGYKFPSNYNPCDYLLQLVIDDIPVPEDSQTASTGSVTASTRSGEVSREYLARMWASRRTEFLDERSVAYQQSSVQENQASANPDTARRRHGPFPGMRRAAGKRMRDITGKEDPTGLPDKYVTGWFTQVRVLSLRALRQKRGAIVDTVQLMQLSAITIIAALFWFRTGTGEEHLSDRVGALFFFPVFWAFFSMFSALFAFPAEKAVLNKDRASGAYRLSAYYFAKSMVETPADMIYPIIFSFVVYWIIGFKATFWAFLTFVVILILLVLAAHSIGLAVSAAVMDVRKGQVLSSVIILTSMLISGFYVNNENVPSFIRPFRYLSFIRYGYEALVRNEVAGVTYPCRTDGEASTVFSVNGENCPVTGQDVLVGLSMEGSLSVAANAGVLICWILCGRLLGYLGLKYLNQSHKPKKRKA